MSLHSSSQILKKLSFEPDGTFDTSNAKYLLRVQIETADYEVKEGDSGTYFTTYGDGGPITFTLPANPKSGLFYYFFQSVGQDMTIATADASEMIADNNAAADQVAMTAQTGALVFTFADGNRWNTAVISNGTSSTVT